MLLLKDFSVIVKNKRWRQNILDPHSSSGKPVSVLAVSLVKQKHKHPSLNRKLKDRDSLYIDGSGDSHALLSWQSSLVAVVVTQLSDLKYTMCCSRTNADGVCVQLVKPCSHADPPGLGMRPLLRLDMLTPVLAMHKHSSGSLCHLVFQQCIWCQFPLSYQLLTAACWLTRPSPLSHSHSYFCLV